MKQFWTYEDIIGRNESAHLNSAMKEFWKLALSIRQGLGRESALLDKYLAAVLTAANKTSLSAAEYDGACSASELCQLCDAVMSGKDKLQNHPMYDVVKAYIDAQPLESHKEETRSSLYCIALDTDLLSHAAEEYCRQKEAELRNVIDLDDLHQLFRGICETLGSADQMERLNLLFRQRFLMITPVQVFLQSLTENLMFCLTQIDGETGQSVLKLWLDGLTTSSDTSQ